MLAALSLRASAQRRMPDVPFPLDRTQIAARRWGWKTAARFPSGRDGEQLRQTYGLLVQRLVYDLFRRRNLRTFGQVRGTNAGASPLPFVIYNDNYAFDEYITAVGNSGFAGVLWSPEVRGGKGEEMLRRTQAVVFSPLALYDDDGETFDYERGEYSWTRLRAGRGVRGEWRGAVTPDPRGTRWRYSDVTWTFMTK
jgi:hypothetical protein